MRGVLPGGNWKLRKKDGPTFVYDTYVRPVSSLAAANGRWRTNAETHHLFPSD
ncbi:hypothetical protein [Streptomyces sp. NPDC014006]|uniref:hypothetical protein n=1 Tax=Streptomyces sp. NPDC014006 TaxID=3364870 RepID=UPI0036F6E445